MVTIVCLGHYFLALAGNHSQKSGAVVKWELENLRSRCLPISHIFKAGGMVAVNYLILPMRMETNAVSEAGDCLSHSLGTFKFREQFW